MNFMGQDLNLQPGRNALSELSAPWASVEPALFALDASVFWPTVQRAAQQRLLRCKGRLRGERRPPHPLPLLCGSFGTV